MLLWFPGRAPEAAGDYAGARASYEKAAELRPDWVQGPQAIERMSNEEH